MESSLRRRHLSGHNGAEEIQDVVKEKGRAKFDNGPNLLGLSSEEWHMSAAAATIHAGFCFLTQVETYTLFLYPLSKETPERQSPEAFVKALLLGQGQVMIVSLLMGITVTMCITRIGWRPTTLLITTIFSIANLYLLVDQTAYSVQFRHISLSQAERVPDSRMLSTLFGSGLNLFFKPLFLINFVLLIFSSRFLAHMYEQRLPPPSCLHVFAGTLAVHLIASVLFDVSPEEHLLKTLFKPADADDTFSARIAKLSTVRQGSPLVGLGKRIHYELIQGDKHHVSGKTPEDIKGPKHHGVLWKASEEDSKESEHIEGFARALRERWSQGRRPTIISFHHEGVGALNVLNQSTGDVDPVAAPFLHKLQKRALTFARMYTTFPSTLRSFIPMLTGGYTATRGDVLGQIRHEFRNATVVSLLKDIGYKTAFVASGSLKFEGLDKFLQGLHYDYFHDFDNLSQEEQAMYKLSGWGARDDVTVKAALAWVDSEMEKGGDTPLFLSLFPCNTHHPYQVPPEFAAKHPLSMFDVNGSARSNNVFGELAARNSDARSKFRRSVAFVDSCLEMLVEGLRSRGLLDDALLLVTGDHGEAFGELHAANRLHKNELFEENLATFALFVPFLDASPTLPAPSLPAPLVSHRLARLGDLLPSLAALLSPQRLHGEAASDRWSRNALTPHGQNLFAKAGDFKTPMLFFHKTANPSKYGLRDGRYKYIAEPTGGLRRLYDLAEDPTEQVDLAAGVQYAELVEDYENLAIDWMRKIHCEWASSLRNYPMAHQACSMPDIAVDRSRRAAAGGGGSLEDQGLRRQDGLVLETIAVGAIVTSETAPLNEKPKFKGSAVINPRQPAVAIMTTWLPLAEDTTVVYQILGVGFHSADLAFRFTLRKGWHTSRYQIRPKEPLKEGQWKAVVRDGFGGVIGETLFTVDAAAALIT